MSTPRAEMERRGWAIEYVPHEELRKYNACYRVESDGRAVHRSPTVERFTGVRR